jgi:hypothetical protein
LSTSAIFASEGPGFTFELYDDRIEVAVKKRTQVLALADVAEVMIGRRPKRLIVVTRAGKQHQYLLQHDVEGARAAVSNQLGRLPAPGATQAAGD